MVYESFSGAQGRHITKEVERSSATTAFCFSFLMLCKYRPAKIHRWMTALLQYLPLWTPYSKIKVPIPEN